MLDEDSPTVCATGFLNLPTSPVIPSQRLPADVPSATQLGLGVPTPLTSSPYPLSAQLDDKFQLQARQLLTPRAELSFDRCPCFSPNSAHYSSKSSGSSLSKF